MLKPVLFNTDMVKSILDGRKTVTRRSVKPQPDEDGLVFDTRVGAWVDTNEKQYKAPCCTGDILWVRETWTPYCMNKESPVKRIYIHGDYCYKATFSDDCRNYDHPGTCNWRPSIHMPKEASRIFLRVTNVRVERLQDIDDDGILAEGLEIGCYFDELWNRTVKPAESPTYGWEANPWVWVISFERIGKEEAIISKSFNFKEKDPCALRQKVGFDSREYLLAVRCFAFDRWTSDDFFLPENWGNNWWKGTFMHPAPIVSGRKWHQVASEFGHAARNKMLPGKVYLFQLYTICFVEFDTVDQAVEFIAYADQNIPRWREDPITIIDTGDLAVAKQWEKHIETEART